MSVIVFYETTDMDTAQLNDELRTTDHYWEYKPGVVASNNINPDAEVISVFVDSRVTREIMDRMPRLRLIATRSTGYDHIDIDHAKKRGITIVNVPTYGENTVAEHAFTLLLAVTKHLIPTVSLTKKGTYEPSHFTGSDLRDKTIGIIGMGHIGKHTAAIARGFGMNVIAYDKHPDANEATSIGFSYVELDDLFMKSDVISLHTPLTASSYHMINAGTIGRMKDGAILINTARGELVENRSLIAALSSGKLAGAGLDTLEGEQFLHTDSIINNLVQKAASPQSYLNTAEVAALLRMHNVVITPHSAYNTREAIARINKTTAQNIIRFWYGDTPNLVKDSPDSGTLVVVRHGQSEWNALGKWTGTTDVHITQKGISDSAELGKLLRHIPFDYAYISQQIRTKETLEALMNGSSQLGLRFEPSLALNERDYGMYTGMRKNEIKKIIGEQAYDDLRRSWDLPVEGGESLKDVYERVIPFYLRIILPRLRHGQNVLLVAHGNSIRSLVKYIENISDETIGTTEMIQNAALCYTVDTEGRSKTKNVIKL